MLTTVLCQCEGWADRTDAEILQRMRRIEADGNLLHGLSPLTRYKGKMQLSLIHGNATQEETDQRRSGND